ncbi:hypothetical protein ACMFMG_011157 [Clarireedia jacksonii]
MSMRKCQLDDPALLSAIWTKIFMLLVYMMQPVDIFVCVVGAGSKEACWSRRTKGLQKRREECIAHCKPGKLVLLLTKRRSSGCYHFIHNLPYFRGFITAIDQETGLVPPKPFC